MRAKPTSVVVALSGGVDSAVAAASLKMAGWEVRGVYFLLTSAALKTGMRTDSVKRVARYLKIPLEVLDLKKVFRRQVIEPFVDAYVKGITPNPCVVCNQLIKFEFLLDYAKQHEIECIATGHYARVTKRDESPCFELRRGKDRRKEQSYFLHRLRQPCLSRAVFPLGERTKDEVQKQARVLGLPVTTVSESQEICFIEENDYRSFVGGQRGPGVNKRGHIINHHGVILGEHNGAFRYTIGQRQGLGIASSRPWYVKEVRPEKNEILVGRKESLYSSNVEAEGFTWIGAMPAKKVVEAQAQIRYRHRAASGHLEIISADKVRFVFNEPQWAITPGQALVCYDGDCVIGGGWIRRIHNGECGMGD